MEEIRLYNQLRLAVYLIIYDGFYDHPNGGCLGFLPSTPGPHDADSSLTAERFLLRGSGFLVTGYM